MDPGDSTNLSSDGVGTWPRRGGARRAFDMDDLALPEMREVIAEPRGSQTWRTPRYREETQQSYEELTTQLSELGPLLETPADEVTDSSWIDAAGTLTTLGDSYVSKYSKNMRSSLQRTVARSVAHSLARQLQSCRVWDSGCSGDLPAVGWIEPRGSRASRPAQQLQRAGSGLQLRT